MANYAKFEEVGKINLGEDGIHPVLKGPNGVYRIDLFLGPTISFKHDDKFRIEISESGEFKLRRNTNHNQKYVEVQPGMFVSDPPYPIY
jgi:hypothetical protein